MWHQQHASLGQLGALPLGPILSQILLSDVSIREIIRLSCTCKTMRILCAEEPMWMELCLANMRGSITYKGTWRATALAFLTDGKAPVFAVEAALRAPHPVNGFHDDGLVRRWWRCHMVVNNFVPQQENVQRADGAALSADEFSRVSRVFENGYQPVMLSGLQEGWPAATAWQASALLERFGERTFSITAPYGRVKMTMRDYLDFTARQCDEVPLYLFDAKFGSTAPEMLQDYSVPHLFRENLFDVLGAKQPDFCWLVMGPARSGADWHIDPNLTSAWNALVSGTKRWALYPPGKVPPAVQVMVDEGNEVKWDGPSSLIWFLEVYPRLPSKERPLEIVQRPGETIFVPGGWWHMVLNLEDSVAVTQNFVSAVQLPTVVEALARGSAHVLSQHGCCDLQAGAPLKVLQGFPRSRLLAPWLHALHRQRPLLRGTVLDLAQSHADLATWRSLATAVATATGLFDKQDLDELPIAGGSSIVFGAGSVFVKLYCRATATAAASNCHAEAVASASTRHSSAGRLRRATTHALAVGSVSPDAAAESSIAEGSEELHFVVMTRAPGLLLDTVGASLSADAWDRLVSELGRLLAELHTMPLPGAALQSHRAATAAGPQLQHSAFACWQGSSGMLLGWDTQSWETQQKCCTECLLERLGAQCRQHHDAGIQWALIDGSNAVSGASSAGTTGRAGSTSPDSTGAPSREACSLSQTAEQLKQRHTCMPGRHSSKQHGGLWQPFADFLRERRKVAPLELAGEASLPLRLHQQLGDYLPADPTILLPNSSLGSAAPEQATCTGADGQSPQVLPPGGSSPTCSGPSEIHSKSAQQDSSAAAGGILPMPALLHGDLIGQNMFVSERLMQPDVAASGSSRPSEGASCGDDGDVCLIDFGDAGHGDPLYDLVLLLVSGLRCKQQLWDQCLHEYTASLGGSEQWWLRSRSGVQPSRVAMTYALLHEQDLASIMFKEFPKLWQLPRLQDVELAVFGCLNDMWSKDASVQL